MTNGTTANRSTFTGIVPRTIPAAALVIIGLTFPAAAQNVAPRTDATTAPALPLTEADEAGQDARVAADPPDRVIISQIHNAPGWQPSRTYPYATGPYTRVV